MESSTEFDYEKYYRKQIHTYYELREWNGLLNYLLLLDKQGILDTGNNEYAVDYLYRLHSYYPDQPDIQLTLWEAIRLSGKPPEKFCWLSRPNVTAVTEKYLAKSSAFITKTRSQVPIFLLHSHLSHDNSLEFDEFDLLQALKSDDRFRVVNDTPFFRYSKIGMSPRGYKNTA